MGSWSHVSVVRREYDVGSWQIARDRVFLGHMRFPERVSSYSPMFWGTMSVHSVSLITYRVRSFCIMEGGGLAETRIQV